MRIEKIMVFVSVGLLLAGCGEAPSDKYSRGVGIYPGNPDETFAPELVEDNETYRNVAALKAAWHSSSYDYNLTAQLVTDGVISTEEPGIINVSTQNGSLKKNEREWFFDDKPDSKYIVEGNDIYLQFDFDNMDIETDKIVLRGDVVVDSQKLGGYEVAAYATADGLKAIGPFVGGANANIDALPAYTIDAAFVGASELIKQQNNLKGVRTGVTTKDFGRAAPTPSDINAKNRAFWSKK